MKIQIIYKIQNVDIANTLNDELIKDGHNPLHIDLVCTNYIRKYDLIADILFKLFPHMSWRTLINDEIQRYKPNVIVCDYDMIRYINEPKKPYRHIFRLGKNYKELIHKINNCFFMGYE